MFASSQNYKEALCEHTDSMFASSQNYKEALCEHTDSEALCEHTDSMFASSQNYKEVSSLKNMFSTFICGTVVGAAAVMYYYKHEQEFASAGRQAQAGTSSAMNFFSNVGQELDNAMRK